MYRTLTTIAAAALAITAASPAFAIDHDQDANWAATVRRIESLSSSQNRGRPILDHYNEPQMEMSTSNLIWYWDPEGHSAFVAVRRNDDGDILQRQVCHFDTGARLARGAMWRYCVDFDTTVKSVEHKNRDDSWKVVADDQMDDAGAGL